MSPNDVQWWSLVVGLALFAALALALLVARRLRERRDRSSPTAGYGALGDDGASGLAADDGETASPRVRRRPASPPPTGEPRELASAIRTAILRSVAERAPAGWTALVLSPPTHPERMTWHVHLAPEVALDLRDGRTVAVVAPDATHEWHVAGGRIVSVGDGDPDPPPGDETVTVRVTGPYLTVAVAGEPDKSSQLVARVVLAGDDELPSPRAVATDLRAVQGALREAIELAVGSRMAGPSPTAGYPPASWRAHERTWLTIGR